MGTHRGSRIIHHQRETRLSYYKRHVFFCCNQREPPEACCNNRGATEMQAYAKQRIKELEREVRELRKTNEILKLASAYFAQAELDRHHKK